MNMDTQKVITGVVGGVIAGFSIGVGFLIAQKTMGGLFHKKSAIKEEGIQSAVSKGVSEGVKQAKVESDAAAFAAMNASRQPKQRSQGRQAMRSMQSPSFVGFNGKESKFEGHPSRMSFNGDPRTFGLTPNGSLNSF
jgi:hypothetical protein